MVLVPWPAFKSTFHQDGFCFVRSATLDYGSIPMSLGVESFLIIGLDVYANIEIDFQFDRQTERQRGS